MKSKVAQFCLIVLVMFSTPSIAQQPITVLLARTTGVSDTDAREMLGQINDLASNSGVGGFGGFESASMIGPIPQVHVVSCSSTNGPSLVSCARTNLSTLRNNTAADIVLLMVSQDITNDCGSVDPAMINPLIVATTNESLGYAVLEKGCFNEQFNGQVTASHEVGHLLYIEHVDGDSSTSLPALAPANHAYENLSDNATAVASAGDCLLGCKWHNFLSDKDKDFPSSSGGGDAGDSSHSNAVDVVQTISWATVAAYRPLPQASPPVVVQLQIACQNKFPIMNVSWFGGGSNPGTSFVADKQNPFGNWDPYFQGGTTCLPNVTPVQGVWMRVKSIGVGMIDSDWTIILVDGDCEDDDDDPL